MKNPDASTRNFWSLSMPYGNKAETFYVSFLLRGSGGNHFPQRRRGQSPRQKHHFNRPATFIAYMHKKSPAEPCSLAGHGFLDVAERMGLEPTASGVTGRRYNRLNYRSAYVDGGTSLLGLATQTTKRIYAKTPALSTFIRGLSSFYFTERKQSTPSRVFFG